VGGDAGGAPSIACGGGVDGTGGSAGGGGRGGAVAVVGAENVEGEEVGAVAAANGEAGLFGEVAVGGVGPVRAVDAAATPAVFAAVGGEDGDVVVADAPPDVDEGGDVAVVMARDVEARGAGGSVVGAFTSAGVVGEATSGEDAAARIWDCGRDGTAADGAADAGVGGTAGDNN